MQILQNDDLFDRKYSPEQRKAQSLVEKWKPVLNEQRLGKINDKYRERVTAQLLENQEHFLKEAASTTTGNISNWDPILIQLVRRLAPKLIAYDICRCATNDRTNWFSFCNAFTLYKWCWSRSIT